jgi:hypothetical protein
MPFMLAVSCLASPSLAEPRFFGPTPYLSSADAPSGLYAAGAPTGIETFEDGSLDFGITEPDGVVLTPSGTTDSVDADDGLIDGSGAAGRSYFTLSGVSGLLFTFAAPVTAAGVVWTDGSDDVYFEAFGPGMVSLGLIGPASIADGSVTGETGEDHFFGVRDPNGIHAIRMWNDVGGIEVDHVQFGEAAPVPAANAPLGFGLAMALLLLARHRLLRHTERPAAAEPQSPPAG